MSCCRHCAIFKSTDGQWYLELGNCEDAGPEDSTTYGPFNTEDDVRKELNNHSNPGGIWFDSTGQQPPPANPARPTRRRW